MNKFLILISLLVLIQSFQIVLSCPDSAYGIRIVEDIDCTNGRRSLGCNAGYINIRNYQKKVINNFKKNILIIAGLGQICRFCGTRGYRSCGERTKCVGPSRTCCSVGKRKVVWDESCRWNPRNGCNAGGQGQECRFV